MDLTQLTALAHQYLPADLWNKAVLAFGYLSLVTQAVPALLAWGVPAVTNAADWLVKGALGSPARPLVIYLAPRIAAALDALAAALTQLMNTFNKEIETDLKAAADVDAAAAAAANKKAAVSADKAQDAPKASA